MSELYHYGVPGMRWGQRKALKRMVRLEKKQFKYEDKANRRSALSEAIVGIKMNAAKKFDTRYTQRLHQEFEASAAKSAAARGEKIAKYQAKSELFREKIEDLAYRKEINIGRQKVTDYIIKNNLL